MRRPDDPRHLDDALSAYLDDELAPAARREADAHLAVCADCRAELDDVAAARHAIRIMPVHAAPRPILDLDRVPGTGPVQAHRRRARAAWALAAGVAAGVAMFLPSEPEVTPSLPTMAGSHAARASITGDPLSQLAPLAVPFRFGP